MVRALLILMIVAFSTIAKTQDNHVETLFNAGKIDAAEQAVEDWVQQNPDNAEAWYWQGVVFAHQASNSFFSAYHYATESLKGFERALELSPNKLRYVKGLISYYKGAPSIVGGGIDKAWSLINQYLGSDSLLTDELYIEAGLLAQQQESFAAARNYFKQAIASKQRYVKMSGLYQLGRTSVFERQSLNQGIIALQAYVDEWQASDSALLLPEDYWAKWRLAQLHLFEGESELANSYVTQIRSIDDKQLQQRIQLWPEWD